MEAFDEKTLWDDHGIIADTLVSLVNFNNM
jgi:hypothetical protein